MTDVSLHPPRWTLALLAMIGLGVVLGAIVLSGGALAVVPEDPAAEGPLEDVGEKETASVGLLEVVAETWETAVAAAEEIAERLEEVEPDA